MERDIHTEDGSMIVKNVITETQHIIINCKFCDSIKVVRYGLTPKRAQIYLCQECKRTFVSRNSPERGHYSNNVISSAIERSHRSSTLREIKKQIGLDFNVSPSLMTIHRWISRYNKATNIESP